MKTGRQGVGDEIVKCYIMIEMIILFTLTYVEQKSVIVKATSEITKILNFKGNYKHKIPNQKLKHITRFDHNCHIPDLEKTFSHVENNRFNLDLYLAKPLTFIQMIESESRIEVYQVKIIAA